MTTSVRVQQDGEDVLIWVKAVPGSSRDQLSGVLGDRLKVRVSAPPEGGQANRSICRTVARAIGVRAKDVLVESGPTGPEKVLRIHRASVDAVRAVIATSL